MNKLLNNLLGMYKQAKMKKSAMIIDEILDRKDGASYNPQDFYDYVSQQLDVLNSKDIATALDSGTEEDVKKALCEYIKLGEYNPAICDYINSVNWLEEEDVEKWFSIKLSDEQAKEFAKLLTENNIKNKSKKEGEEIRVSFFLLPSSIGVAQGLLAATLSKFPDKQAKLNKKAEEDLIEVGWGLYTNDEYEIKDNALYGDDKPQEVNETFWNKINNEIDKVESWFLKEGYKKFFTKVRDEGHGKDSELGGTAWMTENQLKDFMANAEQWDTEFVLAESSGTLDFGNIPVDYNEALSFKLKIYVDDKDLDELGIESKRVSKNKKLSSKNTKLAKKAMRKKAFRKLCLKRAFHKTAGEFEEMMKLKSTDPKLISYLAKEFGVKESTVSQYTDVSENAEELYNILEQQANKYGYEWDKFEYDEYGDRIDEDDFRGDSNDLEKAIEYLKSKIDKTMFKFEYVGTYEENYLTFSVNEKLIPIEKPVIYITNDTKNYDISFFVQSQKSKEEDKAEGIYTEDRLSILIRRTSDEILNEIVNYVNVELPKKIEEQNKKQSSKNSIKAEKNNNLFNSKYKIKIEIVEKKYNEIQTKIKELNDKLQKTDDFEEGEKILKEIETLAQQRDKIGEEQNQLYAEWYKEKTKQEKQSSKAKVVRKQAKNKEIVVTYEGTNGKEYIVKAPNGLYFNEYVDTDTQHSRGAGPFETLEKAKEMFKKHRPSAKEVVATKKQADKVLTLKEAIGKDESEFKNMEDIVDYMNHLPLNANKSSWVVEGFGGNSIDVENLSNGEKATIKLKKNFNSRYATRQNKLSKSATIKHENGVYNVYSESGKCLGKGYKTKEEAEKRLKQVEYFKHKSSLKQVVISKMAKIKKQVRNKK